MLFELYNASSADSTSTLQFLHKILKKTKRVLVMGCNWKDNLAINKSSSPISANETDQRKLKKAESFENFSFSFVIACLQFLFKVTSIFAY